MATGWTPLSLAPVYHRQYPANTEASITKDMESVAEDDSNSTTLAAPTPGRASGLHQKKLDELLQNPAFVGDEHYYTAFDKPIPVRVSDVYMSKIQRGQHYAIYSLVDLSEKELLNLANLLDLSSEAEVNAPTFTLPATYNFSYPGNKNMSDVFHYHTSLISIVAGNPRQLRHDAFLVVPEPLMLVEGVLIVHMDCDPAAPGSVGITRVDAQMAGSCLAGLEAGQVSWADMKAAEHGTHWQNPIDGYTGSTWHNSEGAIAANYDEGIRAKV